MAYGLHEQRRGRVAVYDFGGGTFDVSILKLISTGEGDIYQVLSTNGDTHLGGDDLDNALMEVARTEIRVRHGLNLDAHPEVVQELRKALIQAKHELSSDRSRDGDGAAAGRERLYARDHPRRV